VKNEPFIPGASFRKAAVEKRRHQVREFLDGPPDFLESPDPRSDYLSLTDTLSENTFGIQAFPLGLCRGMIINGEERSAVMSTEEPSVVAAANYACAVIGSGGGFSASPAGSEMGLQLFFSPDREAEYWRSWTEENREHLETLLREAGASMARRGGGFRELLFEKIEGGAKEFAKLTVYIDVRDALGANMLNSCGERLAEFVRSGTSHPPVMTILTNSARRRLAEASFRLKLVHLPRLRGDHALSPMKRAERIVLASDIAAADSDRAVTHNKGIMNGISALALATANDTRALEAAVHAWAARSGRYSSLSSYRITNEPEGPLLEGRFAAPLPLAVVGGAVGFHPGARAALRLMGDPDAAELSEIAACLGLAQNFAALLALTGEGIQAGHMRLHARRIAFAAGARGEALEALAGRLHDEGAYTLSRAAELLKESRS
jgi:hydroxymethylglutaryl-CoA reductase